MYQKFNQCCWEMNVIKYQCIEPLTSWSMHTSKYMYTYMYNISYIMQNHYVLIDRLIYRLISAFILKSQLFLLIPTNKHLLTVQNCQFWPWPADTGHFPVCTTHPVSQTSVLNSPTTFSLSNQDLTSIASYKDLCASLVINNVRELAIVKSVCWEMMIKREKV